MLMRPGDRVELTGPSWLHRKGMRGTVTSTDNMQLRLEADDGAEYLIEEYARGYDVAPLPSEAPAPDAVNHPAHYTSGPRCECGRVIECITVVRDLRMAIGNAIKYLWRGGLKHDADKTATAKQIEDYRKAVWYIEDEIAQLEAAQKESA